MKKSRRKCLVVSILIASAWFFFGFFSISRFDVPESLKEKRESENMFSMSIDKEMEYTLPSLDRLIRSSDDLDVQRALEEYRKNNREKNSSLAGGRRIKVIIVATWRSGSTLLGESLSVIPGVFYHYEPLLPYEMRVFGANDGQAGEIQNNLKSYLSCNYTGQENYLNFMYGHYDMINRNTRLHQICSGMPRFKCTNPENLSKICSIFPFQLMKTVRVRLSTVVSLLEDPDTYAIWLTRDPRATMSSRKFNVNWCTSQHCLDSAELCKGLSSDFSTYLKLRSSNQRVILVRYEDFVTNYIKQTEKILNFIKIPQNNQLDMYLNAHLNSDLDEKEPWSTKHNPKLSISKWRKVTSWGEVVKTQYFCRSVMKKLGYRPFDSENELKVANSITPLNIP